MIKKDNESAVLFSIKLLIFIFIHSLINAGLIGQPSDFLKAKAFEINKQPDSAIYYFNKSIIKKPQDAKLLVQRGNAYLQQKHFELAYADFKLANLITPDIADFDIAKFYALSNDTVNAINYLKKHLESNFKLTQVSIRLDAHFIKFENTKLWNTLWASDWYSKYDFQVGEVRFMLNNNDYLGVINFTSDILKKNSNKHELYFMLACAYFGMDNNSMAIDAFSKAIGSNHRNYEYFKGRGEVYLKILKYKEAFADFSSAINVAPEVFSLYLERAECAYQLKQYDDAFTDITFYLSFFENDKTALVLAGKTAFAKTNYIAALVYLNQVLKQNKNHVQALLIRANTYYKTNLYTNALNDYNNCLKLQPTNVIALRNRGQLYFDQDNIKAACVDWKKATQLGDFDSNNLFLDNCR